MRKPGGALVALAVLTAACTAGSGGSPTSTGPIESSDSTANTSTVDPGDTDGYQICWTNPTSPSDGEITFTDETSAFGLETPLTGMRGHAAAWGDVNGDGISDLVVGTFALARNDVYAVRGATGPSPDRLLVGGDPEFEVSSFPEQFGRTSGAGFADLDGDGDLDLVLSRNANGRDEGASTSVFENNGGTFTEVESGIDPALGGRSIGVLDIDEDGLLDLVILEDRYQGRSSKVYRNTGGLAFDDVGTEVGFPSDVTGLGVATSDLNGDGYTDVFVAGSNRLFLGGDSTLTEAPGVIP
ncbi:MAG TPA: VCBS repeat-containing protein, partial [Acidimicrobiia bacterium]